MQDLDLIPANMSIPNTVLLAWLKIKSCERGGISSVLLLAFIFANKRDKSKVGQSW